MKKIAITAATLMLALSFIIIAPVSVRAENGLSKGQTVYVPAYSHIYSGNKEVQSLLTVTLSIRNTDPNHPIEILSVDYYDTKGTALKKYISAPTTINALGTTRYIVSQNDKTGGSGANFIVKWRSKKPVNLPIIESVMIGSRSSFTSRGQEILPSK